MVRKICLLTMLALGSGFAAPNAVLADHCYRSGGHHSSYRHSVGYPSPTFTNWGSPSYRSYLGQPVPSTFSHGYSSYFAPGYTHGHGIHRPLSTYGVSGYPRYVGSGYGPGFTLHIGR